MLPIKSKKTGFVSLILGITGIIATTNGATAAPSNEIARQTQELKAQAKRQADDSIKATNNGALSQIANIEADKAAAVNNVLANPSIQSTVVPVGYGYRFGRRNRVGFGVINTVDPIATQARINQVNNIAELQKERVKAQAAEKAERLKESQEERARLIDESAENLQSQMVGRGVKLNPHGSNLFVRTYQ